MSHACDSRGKISLAAISVCVGGVILMAGCQSHNGRSIFDPPGTITEQRNEAVRFDPFTDNDIGPEVDGGRPRDYNRPIPEVQRARWQLR
ncbi:MAG: membrane or secreted protein [Pirellulales bacterium]|nr:membrane or secreted protein [Pirellulales bacterium]